MKFSFCDRTLYFYISLVFALLLSLIFAHYTQSIYTGNCSVFTVEVILEVDQEAALEIYCDFGRGFQEENHQKSVITTIGEKVVVQFTVPVWTVFEKIRIDPVGAGIHMKIYEISVFSIADNHKQTVQLELIKPRQQISNGHWNGVSYNFETTPDATDPILLDEKIVASQVNTKERKILVYVLWGISAICSVFFINWIYRFFILGGRL